MKNKPINLYKSRRKMKKETTITVTNPQAYFPEGALIPSQENLQRKKTTDPKIEYSF